MREHGAHRRGGQGITILALTGLLAFVLGWVGATAYGSADRHAPAPAPPPAPAAPRTAAQANSPGPDGSVGLAQPTLTPAGLEVTAVFTKIKGGVDITVIAENRSDRPIQLSTTSLGPHETTFRGASVDTQMAPRSKKLVPGEALTYPCRVRLPDMNSGELAFTVADIRVRGQAAGD